MWGAAKFDIANSTGPYRVAGYTHLGLGLHVGVPASPKGRRPAVWVLTHLGSGHRIAHISGSVSEAFPIATELAEAGDWTFDGLRGWQNQFPDAKEKTAEWLAKYPKQTERSGGGGQHEGVAQSIAIARAA